MPTPVDLRELELFVRPCNYCKGGILWGKTVGAEWMPLDADPSPNGNVLPYLDPTDRRRLLVHVIGHRGVLRKLRAGGISLFTHHRMSCPDADRWARLHKHERPTPRGFAAARPAVPTTEHDEPLGLF
jgi:hypothetical protein